jgi:hypothetical protein
VHCAVVVVTGCVVVVACCVVVVAGWVVVVLGGSVVELPGQLRWMSSMPPDPRSVTTSFHTPSFGGRRPSPAVALGVAAASRRGWCLPILVEQLDLGRAFGVADVDELQTANAHRSERREVELLRSRRVLLVVRIVDETVGGLASVR